MRGQSLTLSRRASSSQYKKPLSVIAIKRSGDETNQNQICGLQARKSAFAPPRTHQTTHLRHRNNLSSTSTSTRGTFNDSGKIEHCIPASARVRLPSLSQLTLDLCTVNIEHCTQSLDLALWSETSAVPPGMAVKVVCKERSARFASRLKSCSRIRTRPPNSQSQ